LRAFSVLSVIGFHAFPSWIEDGFVGVDIFFVIFGFLISTIILENLDRGGFSFAEFYRRRIKRIFPALLVVLSACLIVGWFELLEDEYSQLGKHIAASAGFVSNFLLWSESGYFDSAAETKPLLHLWSLGIEEQFYIVWPLMLWLAWKRNFNLLLLIAAIAAASFALNVWQVRTHTVVSFYSPLTRFWELLIGSALAYLSLFKPESLKQFPFRNSDLLSGCGVLLLGICFLLVTKDRAFPGWWALLPTVAAALIISAGTQAWVNRKVLSNPVLVWFGLISFPLYLWHWPLLAFLRIFEDRPTPLIRLVAIIISIVLAWFTYKLIEKPIRFGMHSAKMAYALAAVLAIVGSAGYWSLIEKGFPGYGPRIGELSSFAQYFENSLPAQNYFETTGISHKYRFDCDFYDLEKFKIGKSTIVPVSTIDKSCYERAPGNEKAVFIWGDSHAQQLYFGLRRNLPKSWDILIVASSGCGSRFSNEDSKTDYCERSNWFALKKIKETRPNIVIIAQASGHQFDELMNIGTLLKKEGVEKVIFTGLTPHWTSDLPKIIIRRLWNGTPERTLVGIDHNRVAEDRNLKAKFSNQSVFVFVDLIDFFCNEDGCLTRIGNDKKEGITSWDYGHLTPIASDYLVKNLLAQIVVGGEQETGSAPTRAN
jgi:peptidoglycan/LPS O-acetylase OafA/YrhL